MTTEMDSEMVMRAFVMMARHLERNRRRGEIVIAGGAVMALQYDVDRVTRDVDGLITEGHGAVIEAAHSVAADLGLPRGWLNEGVSAYLSTVPDESRTLVFDHQNLIIYGASTEHMLALKARAARAQDVGDLRVLVDALQLTSAQDVVETAAKFFPDDPLSERANAAIEDLFD